MRGRVFLVRHGATELAGEAQAKRRLVLETDRFVVFHPFASRAPFETWVAPKRHQPSFGKDYYLWHIQILPRVTTIAGFELGSGIYITTMLPEESAAFLREFMPGRETGPR